MAIDIESIAANSMVVKARAGKYNTALLMIIIRGWLVNRALIHNCVQIGNEIVDSQ